MNLHIRNGLFALGALALTACSGSAGSWLQGVTATTTTSGALQVTLDAQINSAQINLSPVDFQFYQPNDPTQLMASLDITNPSATQTDVVFMYDFSGISALASMSSTATTTTLPNGTPIPVPGPNPTWNVWQSSASSKALVYWNIDMSAKQGGIGFVLVADALSAGQTGDLLLNFTMTGLSGSGSGGIFSGATTGTSGFCLFADVSSLFSSASKKALAATDLTPDSVKVEIERRLYELNQEHAHINFK